MFLLPKLLTYLVFQSFEFDEVSLTFLLLSLQNGPLVSDGINRSVVSLTFLLLSLQSGPLVPDGINRSVVSLTFLLLSLQNGPLVPDGINRSVVSLTFVLLSLQSGPLVPDGINRSVVSLSIWTQFIIYILRYVIIIKTKVLLTQAQMTLFDFGYSAQAIKCSCYQNF